MTFDLNTTAQADQLSRARLNPLSVGDLSPGFFEGSLTAPFTGLARGIIGKGAALAGEAFTPVLRPIARDIDKLFGTDTVGFLEDERRKNVEFLKATIPDPETTGVAGQVLHGLFDIAPAAILAGPFTAGALETASQKLLLEDKGVDSRTATLTATAQGIATGVGVGLPLSLGLKAAPDLLYAAASNVAPNVAARALSHQILAAEGYTDMAEQYKALDAQAIAADAVLGVFFAGAGKLAGAVRQRLDARMTASALDAALAARSAKHLEIDTAPGIPRDPITRDAHVQSVVKAMDDLIAGRPVDVAGRMDEADFSPNPMRQAVSDALSVHAKSYAEIDSAAAALRSVDEAPAKMPEPETTRAPEVTPEPKATTPPDGEAQPKAAAVPEPEIAAAQRVVQDMPDLGVMDENGNVVRAADLLAKADEDIALVKNEAKGFEAAISCLLRTAA